MTHDSSPFGPGAVAGRTGPAQSEPASLGMFDRVFNPMQPGVLGLVGRISGAQTQQQFALEQETAAEQNVLSARNRGLTALTHALQADGGQNPQRVLMEFFTSEVGNNALTHGGDDFLKAVKSIVTPFLPTAATQTFRDEAARRGMTPEQLQEEIFNEGQEDDARADRALDQSDTRIDQRDAEQALSQKRFDLRSLEFKQGTTEGQNNERKAALLGMTVAEYERIIFESRGTPQEAALRNLIAAGKLSSESRDLMIGGLMKISEIRGGLTGLEPTGRFQITLMNPDDLTVTVSKTIIHAPDAATAEAFRALDPDAPSGEPGDAVVPSTPAAGGPSVTPGAPTQPATPLGAPAPPTAPPTPIDPNSPFAGMDEITAASARAGGVKGLIRRIINVTGGQFFENLSDDEIVVFTGQLRELRARYRAVIASDAVGRLTGEERKEALKNVDLLGIATSPRSNLIAMFRLRKTIDQMITNVDVVIADSTGELSTPKTREEAARRKAVLVEGLTFLPSVEDLEAERLKMADEDSFGGFFDFLNKTFDVVEEDLGAVAPDVDGAPPDEGAPSAPSKLERILKEPLPQEEREGVVLPPAELPGADPLVTMAPFNVIDAEAIAAVDDPDVLERIGEAMAGLDEAAFELILPELRGPVETLINVGQGMNKTLATVAGVSTEAMNEALVALFDQGFLDNPGDGEEAINMALRKVGVFKRAEINSLAEEFGQSMFIALVSAAVMAAAAPAVATQAAITTGQIAVNMAIVTGGKASRTFAALGSGARQLFVDLSRMIRDNPLRFLISESAAVGGLTAGRRIANSKDLGPGATMLLELTGGILGAGLFGVLTFAPQSMFRQAKTVFGTAAQEERFLPAAVEKLGRFATKLATGITLPGRLPREFSVISVQKTAAESLARERYRVNFSARQIIGRFAPGVLNNNVKESRGFVTAIKNLYTKAQDRASVLWNGDPAKGIPGVPLKTNMTAQNKELVEFIRTEIDVNMPTAPKSRAAEIPVELVDDINSLITVTPRGTVTTKQTYIDYRGYRRRIRTQLEDPTTTDTQRRALVKIDQKLMDLIVKASPDPGMLARANAYTRWLHQRFSEGPFQEIISGRAKLLRSGDVVKVARSAITAERGPQFLDDIARTLDDPQGLIAAENTIRATMRRDLDSIMEAEARKVEIVGGTQLEMDVNAARAAARELVSSKMLADPELQAFFKTFPKTAARVQTTTTKLVAVLADARRIENGALKLFTDLEADDAITVLLKLPTTLGNSEMEATAHILVRNMRNDPDALAALRFALLKRYTADVSGNMKMPSDALREMTAGNNGKLSRIIFGDEGYSRVRNILAAGVSLTSGGASMFRMFAPLADVVGRFGGAGATRLIGGRTIQQTGVGANLGKKFMLGLTSRFDPLTMLARALRDPQMEAFLLSRAPITNAEFKIMERKMQFLITNIIAETHLLALPLEKSK